MTLYLPSQQNRLATTASSQELCSIMLPSTSQTFPFSGGGAPAPFYPVQGGYPDMTFTDQMFPAQLLPDQNLDPNSPELFKENIKFVQTHLRHVQSLARDVLDGIERAYEGQTNPTQTAASIAALKQSLHNLSDVLRTTGVGALPLISINAVQPPQEEQLVEQTTNAIKGLFNRNTRNQESAAVVASLLIAPETNLRR